MPERRFEIIVRALLKDKNNGILFVKRVKAPEKGKWSFPGGKVELGETFAEALIRELKEELQVDFSSPKFLVYSEKPDNFSLHTITFHFTGSYHGAIIAKTDENSEYKFFQKEDVVQGHNFAWNHKEIALGVLKK